MGEAMRRNSEFGPDEGYRWVLQHVNKKVSPQRIGRERVRKSLARLMPAWVDKRKAAIENRLIRRTYAAPYYLHADHIDLNCKLTFSGGVKLYIYGHVCARSLLISCLTFSRRTSRRACFRSMATRAFSRGCIRST